MKFCLIGNPVKHSFSKNVHEKYFNCPYDLVELLPNELSRFMAKKDFDGINVTLPYKQSVIEYCDALTKTAAEIGAVNTIVKQKDGSLLGDNTDFFGLLYTIKNLGLENKKVVVLGSGGTSKTAVCVLNSLLANPVVVSRNGEQNYQNISNHSDAFMIVNTTPVGMVPNSNKTPVDVGLFKNLSAVVDVVYNPLLTKLCFEAEQNGIKAVGGLSMLVAQAAKGNELFLGKNGQTEKIEFIKNEVKAQKQNVVLIGMPGSGKTTVGNKLAKRLSKTFVDIDDEIKKQYSKTPKEIIETKGESVFRQCETEVLKRFSEQNSLVISTGGGVVTVEQNKFLLKQNGILFFLDRDIKNLETKGRPLSQKQGLEKLYNERIDRYLDFADHTVSRSENLDQRIDEILEKL